MQNSMHMNVLDETQTIKKPALLDETQATKKSALLDGAQVVKDPAFLVQKKRNTDKGFVLSPSEKTRAVIFLCIVTGVLFFLLIYLVLASVISELPKNGHLILEQRSATQCEALNIQTVANASFQQSFEKYASDALPMRDEVLLANAYVQRSCIQLANCVFSYDVYPAYYGCMQVYSNTDGRICRMSYTQTEKFEKNLQTCADGLNNLEEYIPGKLVYCLPTNMPTSKLNPSSSLIPNVIDENYMQEKFLDKLDSRWLTFADTYDSIEEYSKNYFYSDHHWNINGAVKNYEQIMKLLEKEPVNFSDSYKVDSLKGFYGSYAREAMDLQVRADYISDVDYARSELIVTADGELQTEAGFLDDGYEKDYSKRWQQTKSYSNPYAGYFHSTYGELVLENPNCNNGETLLLIGDSFSGCMDRFFAESYSRVVAVNPRKIQGKLSDIAQKYNAKDCVCLLIDSTLQTPATLETFQR